MSIFKRVFTTGIFLKLRIFLKIDLNNKKINTKNTHTYKDVKRKGCLSFVIIIIILVALVCI